MRWIVAAFTLLALLACSAFTNPGDPYTILRVKRNAAPHEIRRAYKQLAKEWHPDKNKDPSAEEHFVHIKQAYELLSDPERRKKYDNHGITEENIDQRSEYYFTHPFDEFFSEHSRRFNYQEQDITFFHNLSVSTRKYDKVIVPNSTKVPYLIVFYSDWCFSCLQVAMTCRKLIDYLHPLGVELIAVHANREPSINRRLNIQQVPSLALLLDENVYLYKDSFNVTKIIDFLKSKLPYQLVPKITTSNLDDFLNGWEDNRVRALIFESKPNIKLRYLITAFYFRDRVAFGLVDSEDIRKKYRVPHDMDSVFIFHENTSRPIASVGMKNNIPTTTLHTIISSNQYLALPRLSSQSILDSLCPCEWTTLNKKLCVVLVTSRTSSHDTHRESFRFYAQNAPYSTSRVRFAYIYHDKQMDFVNALIPDGESVEPLLSVVIIWRRDTSHIKYEWLSDKWEVDKDINNTAQKLEATITRLLKHKEGLTYEAFVKDLFDEHAKGIFVRIFTKLVTFTGTVYDSLDKSQILPAISVLGTIVFILIIGYFMAYLVRLEEENIKQQKANSGNNNNERSGPNGSYQPELKLHELRSEKYNGLVRLLKPGCRTILLVCDMQSRQTLIPPFHKACWPYRKNKTLMFSYMVVERGLSWYKEVLQLSLPNGRELNINPRNCVGTVLALNGHRKYFCMFHAKHMEKKYKQKNGTKKLETKDCEAGAFIGFDSDTSDSDDEVLLQGDLLDGLPNWLDRLFEGTTHRFYINYWPEFPNK